MSDETELSFYRDLHKVAYFVLLTLNALIVFGIVVGLFKGQFSDAFYAFISWGLISLLMNFIGKRTWPDKYAEAARLKAEHRATHGVFFKDKHGQPVFGPGIAPKEPL